MKQEDLLKHIIVDPHIQHGKPCIKGTRVPVYVILEALALGMREDEIQQEYGPLAEEDIHACLYYAALLANEQEVITSKSN